MLSTFDERLLHVEVGRQTRLRAERVSSSVSSCSADVRPRNLEPLLQRPDVDVVERDLGRQADEHVLQVGVARLGGRRGRVDRAADAAEHIELPARVEAERVRPGDAADPRVAAGAAHPRRAGRVDRRPQLRRADRRTLARASRSRDIAVRTSRLPSTARRTSDGQLRIAEGLPPARQSSSGVSGTRRDRRRHQAAGAVGTGGWYRRRRTPHAGATWPTATDRRSQCAEHATASAADVSTAIHGAAHRWG